MNNDTIIIDMIKIDTIGIDEIRNESIKKHEHCMMKIDLIHDDLILMDGINIKYITNLPEQNFEKIDLIKND